MQKGRRVRSHNIVPFGMGGFQLSYYFIRTRYRMSIVRHGAPNITQQHIAPSITLRCIRKAIFVLPCPAFIKTRLTDCKSCNPTLTSFYSVVKENTLNKQKKAFLLHMLALVKMPFRKIGSSCFLCFSKTTIK